MVSLWKARKNWTVGLRTAFGAWGMCIIPLLDVVDWDDVGDCKGNPSQKLVGPTSGVGKASWGLEGLKSGFSISQGSSRESSSISSSKWFVNWSGDVSLVGEQLLEADENLTIVASYSTSDKSKLRLDSEPLVDGRFFSTSSLGTHFFFFPFFEGIG